MTPLPAVPEPVLHPTSPVLENAFLENLTRRFARCPEQVNALHESDAELLRLPGGALLAATTDTIVEEIASGLYGNPWLIGWMTVIVNASDLAAVGAEPLGLLLSQTLPADVDSAWLAELQRGIDEASRAAGLAILGGDVNFSSVPQMGATALGLVSGGRPLTRVGATPGDRLMASGPLGTGAAFALRHFTAPCVPIGAFRPVPRLREGRILRSFASACIDTSDGVIPALDQLARLNHAGFEIDRPLERMLEPGALETARQAGLPEWTLLAGPHGEFELLFTVPARALETFRPAARAIGWEPLDLGAVTAEPEIRLTGDGNAVLVDSAAIRNLAATAASDVAAYVVGLRNLVSTGGTARREDPR